jgi:hypothetical protein
LNTQARNFAGSKDRKNEGREEKREESDEVHITVSMKRMASGECIDGTSDSW